MDLRQLRYFVAVANAGTYIAAAAAEHVAQPALWRQVRNLETELGLPLFERIGRRVRLTRAGDVLREAAIAALAAADRVAGTAEELRSAQGGTLAIACAAPHVREFLARVIADFRTEHPSVRLEVREYPGGPGPGRGMREDLLSGLVDLATGAPRGQPGVDSIALYVSRVVLAVPDDHPWRSEPAVEAARLRGIPLVSTLPGAFSRTELDRAAREAGFEPTIALESASPLTLHALGRAGVGIPILVEDALDHPTAPPWPALADGHGPIQHEIRLGWRSGAALRGPAARFVAFAQVEAARRASA